MTVQRLYRDHDFVPFPDRHGFAEVRMVYCTRCGATQVVEATGAPRDPLPSCPSFVAPVDPQSPTGEGER